MTTTGATMAKETLRREIRARRRAKATERDRRADAEALTAAVLATLTGDVITVAAYEALPTEPPTQLLVDALLARGIQVLLPVLLPDKDLDWRAAGPERGVLLGTDGIARADLVLAPALAVDHRGVRLGQGGGSYDRALARRSPAARVVAVVNDEEYVEGPLPHEPHDAEVDAVVTPGRGLVPVRRGSAQG